MKIDYPSQRAKYKGMTREQIVRSMSLKELTRNARSGGVDAIEELTRRKKKARLTRGIIPDNDIDIGV